MSFLRTQNSWAPVFARLALGIIFIAHGSQKAFGLFGGGGWSKTIEGFEQHMGLPAIVAMIVIVTELLGGLAVFFGLLTRLAALGLGIIMAGAIYTVHLQHGLFINWYMVPDKGHGFEYSLALIGLALVLLTTGGGNLSIDKMISSEK